jgi:hypothetical protein
MRYLFISLILILSACHIVEPLHTDEAEEFDPDTTVVYGHPGGYRALWDTVQICTGIRGDFDRVRWMVYPNRRISFPLNDGDVAAGYSDYRHHTIYFAYNWVNQAFYIKHEMIHELRQQGGHPYVPFKVPCNVLEP